MRIRHFFRDLGNEGEAIACFGDARLVKTLDCKYELRGGSDADRVSAQEWIPMFMHEAVPWGSRKDGVRETQEMRASLFCPLLLERVMAK